MAKEKRRLDRRRPYGAIFGAGSACYEQHGIQFDSAGEEMPGFEDVEIREESVTAAGCDEGLNREIAEANTRLQAELGKLRDDLAEAREAKADAEARAEEIQGQLDTANVEIERLGGLLAEAGGTGPEAAAGEAKEKPADDKGKKKSGKELDDQLALQTGGGAS